MIDYIKAKIVYKGLGFVVAECGDIGYNLLVSDNTARELFLNQEQMVYIHLIVREDALQMVGFSSLEEREMFELLIGVSKIGAKIALAVLSLYRPEQIVSFVRNADTVALSKVSGLGKKTAERLILELKDKVKHLWVEKEMLEEFSKGELARKPEVVEEVEEALRMLGFSSKEAETASRKAYSLDKKAGVENIVKTALNILRK